MQVKDLFCEYGRRWDENIKQILSCDEKEAKIISLRWETG